jgi:hypothetical protein
MPTPVATESRTAADRIIGSSVTKLFHFLANYSAGSIGDLASIGEILSGDLLPAES